MAAGAAGIVALSFKGVGGHQSARAMTNEWLTPPEILAALGGWESFDLDPCAPVERPWPTARQHFTKLDNGLRRDWRPYPRIYLNPPYAKSLIGQFLARIAEHGRGIALIFARTETEAFCRHVWPHVAGLLFVAGRLNFRKPDGSIAYRPDGKTIANAGAPSVLCAYGAAELDVLAGCGIDGHLVVLQLPRGVMVAALDATWREAIADWLAAQDGPVRLDEIYRAFRRHPKAARNPNFKAKIRQVLQAAPFRRVDRGLYAAGGAHG